MITYKLNRKELSNRNPMVKNKASKALVVTNAELEKFAPVLLQVLNKLVK